ncbi:CDP-alcohol phosphatidyltransferase family protein [Mangrovibrevibacter kandeliae]|uniref:CDP-alcohol phosphatidyltransferase family protein n=1 Tax=Mangrovibrevibacter kandeliae TaxID=2968473 RepID=UPI0021195C6B|nr:MULTISPECIES: phosphatidylcholine/phosphatidylserine synthase [unclassified Aurantimonas]MCQ8781355.1 phosphatidylcholine/phosphatidylserine synthase [Aurantimonas sp. CSK15Z-1]MCW4114137.1 phosphatidylcholine/phosphatidylserine synthase [Aurantimonas sp. MSK8Z-1]
MGGPIVQPEPEEDETAQDASVQPRAWIPFRQIVPNLITILAICAGMTGIRLAFEGRFELAVLMILGAAFLDGIDGRIARMLKGQSRFGAEMDSLADIVNFGVAPGLVLYAYTLHEAGAFGWIAALLYATTCALRLARFNTMLDDPNRPKWQTAYFVGVPAPAGAGLALFPAYLGFVGPDTGYPQLSAGFSAVYLVVIGGLMASQIPTWSGKTIAVRVRRDYVAPVILVLVAYVALLSSYLWQTLVFTGLAYLVSIGFSVRSYRRRARKEAMALDGD